MKLGVPWTDDEVQVLNSAFTAGHNWEDIARSLPGRSVGACQARMKRQENLKFTQLRKNSVCKERVQKAKKVERHTDQSPWTTAEDELLVHLLTRRMSPTQVYRRFPHRSKVAVAYRVGISWSKDGGEDLGLKGHAEDEHMGSDADVSDIGTSTAPSPTPSTEPSSSTAAISRQAAVYGPYAPTADDCRPCNQAIEDFSEEDSGESEFGQQNLEALVKTFESINRPGAKVRELREQMKKQVHEDSRKRSSHSYARKV